MLFGLSMSLIRNRGQLLGDRSLDDVPSARHAREIALNVLESVLLSIHPKELLQKAVYVDDTFLVAGKVALNLDFFERVLVIGAGKAVGSMAEGLEDILADRIDDGIIVVPRGSAQKHRLRRINQHEASHPIPNEDSVEGARRILKAVDLVGTKDLVICLFSGGASSLLALPREGISLADKQAMTQMLLNSGANINELNTVRKHLSGIKGGQLAVRCHPATVVSLILSDVTRDRLDVIASGPAAPDPTTFKDALSVIEKYGLVKSSPQPVLGILQRGLQGLVTETPKEDSEVFQNVHSIVIGNNRLACSVATRALEGLGLGSLLLTSLADGEARQTGQFLGAVAKEIAASGNPIAVPCGLVVGGETTVKVTGHGKGGRNQEMALGAALAIDGLEGVAIACINTDGIDGPTDAAGAIVDGLTIQRSKDLGLDPIALLADNDSYRFFSALGDHIHTGETGTNLNDLAVVILTDSLTVSTQEELPEPPFH